MDYFEFYGLPVSFLTDEMLVKQKFFELSRRYHPDFFATAAPEQQQEALRLSTLNTKAFQTLSDFDRRMKYILESKNVISEGGKHGLDPGFLAEMMDINEGMLELKENMDVGKWKRLREEALFKIKSMRNEIEPALRLFEKDQDRMDTLLQIKDYYLRKRYLLRILESLDSFNPS